MARVKYVPPTGVSDMPGYIAYVQGLMAKAHTDPAAFQEANSRMGEKAIGAFQRWLAGRPQEWDASRTLESIYQNASVTEAFGKVSKGDKGSTGIGIFQTPDANVVFKVIAMTAAEAESEDEAE